MPKEHARPTNSTAKQLYANAFCCGHEGCGRPLYLIDNETGNRTLNSRICHINARSEGGPRWDPKQSDQDNRSEQNLILMCLEHAAKIDDPALMHKYPSEKLREWKARQLQKFDDLCKQGWMLDDKMASEAIELSSSGHAVQISDSTISLGGEGGKAPGAGGGGGGAIGPNARGGDGGSGGDLKLLFVDFASTDADKLEFVIGKGGKAAHLPGQVGGDGGDTLVNIRRKDGRLLDSVHAAGGGGGKSGASYLPDGVPEVSSHDVDTGFHVSTLLTANSVEMRDGLLFIQGGGWTIFHIPTLPVDATWHVVFCVTWPRPSVLEPRGVYLSVYDPSGREASCCAIELKRQWLDTGTALMFQPIGMTLDAEGPWIVRIHSGSYKLAEIAVDVQTRA